MLRQRSNRNEASSDRALGKSYALLALAVLVYGCDFELEVSGFPVSLVLHAVGLAAVAAATLVFRRHRGSSAGTWLLVGTVLLALDLGAFLADHFAGSSRALELLVAAAPALRLAGLLALVAGLGGDAAGREWERAARAWRWTLLAALGIYALPFAALFLAALVWGELDYTSHSLGFLALMLAVLGLPYALGLHALAARMVQHADGPSEELLAAGPRLVRLLGRTSVERALPPTGTLAATAWDGHGFAARAAGSPMDARSADPSYDGLGFTPVCAGGGDVRARWRQRLAEIEQSIALVAAAGARLHEPGSVVENPASVTAELLPVLPDLLVGLEWGDAVAVVDSLDLDLRRTVPVDQAAT